MRLIFHGGIISFWVAMMLQLFLRQAQFEGEAVLPKEFQEIPEVTHEFIELNIYQKRLSIAEVVISKNLYYIRARVGFQFQKKNFDLSFKGYLVTVQNDQPQRLNLEISLSPMGGTDPPAEFRIKGFRMGDQFEMSLFQSDKIEEKIVIPFGEKLSQWILNIPRFLKGDTLGAWEFLGLQLCRIKSSNSFSAYSLDYPPIDSLWTLQDKDDRTRH